MIIQYSFWSHIPQSVIRFIGLNSPFLSLFSMSFLLSLCLLMLLLEAGVLFILPNIVRKVSLQQLLDKPLWIATILSSIVSVNAWRRWDMYNHLLQLPVSMPDGASSSFHNAMVEAMILFVISWILIAVSVSSIFILRSKLFPQLWFAKYKNKARESLFQVHRSRE